MKVLHKIRVILALNKKSINILLGQLYAIYVAWNANQGQFPNPVIAVAAYLALWQAASAAQQLVQAKAHGAVAARGPKVAAVLNAAEQFRAYVESLCVNLTSEQAAALAAAGGMQLAALPVHKKPALQANRGAVSGAVVLIANALLLAGGSRGRRCFNWQSSTDGKNWVSLPSTPDAITTVSGLTPLTAYLFRVSVSTTKGEGAWSQAVSVVVH
jgi:hypothetical protein